MKDLSELLAILLWASEAMCMASNVYHEARGEPELGQIAVAQVTLNRVRSRRYPDTVCGVVFQRRQFSWANNGMRYPRNLQAWERSIDLALAALDGQLPDVVGGATHFHARSVSPYWAQVFHEVGPVGNHIFYIERSL